jgi:hypothetical protein
MLTGVIVPSTVPGTVWPTVAGYSWPPSTGAATDVDEGATTFAPVAVLTAVGWAWTTTAGVVTAGAAVVGADVLGAVGGVAGLGAGGGAPCAFKAAATTKVVKRLLILSFIIRLYPFFLNISSNEIRR